MTDDTKPMVYSVDDETKGLLTELLNITEGLADLQMTDDATDELRLLNRMLGERFGIEFSEIVLESDQDSEGNPRFTVKTYREKPSATDKPSYLRLVSDNDNPPKATDGASNNKDDEQG